VLSKQASKKDLEPDEDADARTPEKGLTPTMIDGALLRLRF
jgi:hypothetical protein